MLVKIERTPVPVPVSCYATWRGDEKCAACAFRTGCRSVSKGRLPLSRATFDLKTEHLDKPLRKQASEDVEVAYRTAFSVVFKRKEKPDISADTQRKIRAAAVKSQCTPFQLCVILMSLWKKTTDPNNQHREDFKPWMLCRPYADTVIREARAYAVAHYGGFCQAGLDSLCSTGSGQTVLETRMYRSELVFAKAVIASRMAGDNIKVDQLVARLEFQMDAVWLALEDAYHVTYVKHLRSLDETSPANKHRYAVTIAKQELKNGNNLPTALKIRSQVMLRVLAEVLREFGIQPDAFSTHEPVTNAVVFWRGVANAISQSRALAEYARLSAFFEKTAVL